MPETDTTNSKKDQIFKQLKDTWENREAIQKQVKETLQTTKTTVEFTAKALIEQSKTNPMVHEYIVPIMENEKTEKVLTKLNSTFGQNKFIGEFEKFRKELIDAKVSKAKPVSEVDTEAQSAASATSNETTSNTTTETTETTDTTGTQKTSH